MLRSIIQSTSRRKRVQVTDHARIDDIVKRTMTEVETLSATVEDPAALVARAMAEVSDLYEGQDHCAEDDLVKHLLEQLPERDRIILAHFKAGMKHTEIAELLHTDVHSVRISLITTYSQMRLLVIA